MIGQAECETLCARVAGSGDIPIFPVSGLCQFQAQGYTISDLVVTGCTIDAVAFQPVAEVPRAALMTVTYEVGFEFTATYPDGHQARQSAVCAGSVQFIQPVTLTHGQLIVPPQCTPSLNCRATDAGFDATTAIQSFVVLISGSVNCLSCSQREVLVNVQLCPSSDAPAAGGAQQLVGGRVPPAAPWPRP